MLIDGNAAANHYINNVLIPEVNTLSRTPNLAIIHGVLSKDSAMYMRSLTRIAKTIGVTIQEHYFLNENHPKAIQEKIARLNQQSDLDGVIALNPFPEELRAMIDPNKDIEGIGLNTLFRLYTMRNSLITNYPATPLGIIMFLDYYNIPIDGKHVVIVGRSNTIGRPLFYMMERRGATCTQCHSKTAPLSQYTQSADIIISACGIPNIITDYMIRPGTVVIDAGINFYNNRICGDVDFENVSKKTGLITPVPGGVGPMTNVALYTNLINRCKENCNYGR